jgi:acyl transferase domain-containing protein
MDHVERQMSDSEEFDQEDNQGFAIVGMACRFPGAKDIDEFWSNLRNGVESVTFFSEQEQLDSGLPSAFLKNPNQVNAGAVLDGAEYFDAAFFGFNPREAEVMDPQHRIFLETAWTALEHAGYDSEKYTGRVGVYCGVSMNTYLLFNLMPNLEIIESVGDLQIMIGNDKDYLPTRVSHRLNLKGPSIDVQSACSTSLVAVHLACQSLMAGESDMALAGGVSIGFPQKMGYLYQEGGLLSPDGHCRSFDARGKGTVDGSGAGVVIIKRLADAIADGDTVLAVIKGSAVNNDGASRAGYAAPSVEGQTAVIEEALALSGVEVETITYMEAHGGATPLGDSIEVTALTRAFQSSTQRNRFCALGSVKTNIGHLSAAAGIAGLIKCVLALQHKYIPPSLNFEQPNPNIDFENAPFYVNTQLTEWRAGDAPRRAGINAFGIGGTNAHVILEEAPQSNQSDDSHSWQLILLSAKTDSALESATSNLIDYLKRVRGSVNLPDVAYTLQVGRRSFNHRRMLVCRDIDDAVIELEKRDPLRISGSVEGATDRAVAFMFPGPSDHYANMASGLYALEPTFKQQVDLCNRLLEPVLGFDLLKVLYTDEPDIDEATKELNRSSLAECALFITEYALAKLWIERGVYPQAMIGTSAGEYVVACLAGVFSLEDALKLLAIRRRIMMREETSQGLLASLEEINLNPPQIPFVSSVTGKWITEAEATDPAYWVSQFHQPDRFAQGLQELWKDADWILLEVGPGRALSSIAEMQPSKPSQCVAFSSIKQAQDKQPDDEFLLRTVGLLWLAGVRIDWHGMHAHKQRRRIPLPTYPFEGRRYWIAPRSQPAPVDGPQNSLEKKPDVSDWFYFPIWKHTAPLAGRNARKSLSKKSRWLLFNDQCGLGSSLIERLRLEGDEVISVEAGEGFARLDALTYTIHPERAEDYEKLFQELRACDQSAERIIHLWSVSHNDNARNDDARNDDARFESLSSDRIAASGFYSLLFLAQNLARDAENALELWIISNDAQAVSGDESLCPQKAMQLGLCKVISKEIPEIVCHSIDVAIGEAASLKASRLVDQLIAEFSESSRDLIVAYRGSHRLIQSFEKISLDGKDADVPALRHKGVYLVTGGLGRIGFELASYLAVTVQAQVAIVDVEPFPARESWDEWLADHNEGESISDKISKLRAFENNEADENNEAEFLILRADVTDARQMQDVIAQVKTRFGKINGIIHAASVAEEGLIQAGAASTARTVLAPKVEGTLVLDALFKDSPLDFFITCSSLGSFLGEPARVSSCAADAFLDAYSCLNSYENRTRVISINWDQWRDATLQERAGEAIGEGIGHEEAFDVFTRILNSRLPRVIVSMRDLNAVMEQSRSITASRLTDESRQAALSMRMRPRPELSTPYLAPRNQAEEIITRAWQQIFGIEGIGVDDNFFELGGDSILSILIASHTNKAGLRLTAGQVLEHPTISQLAAVTAQTSDAIAAAESQSASDPALSGFADFDWSQEDLDRFNKTISAKFQSLESE